MERRVDRLADEQTVLLPTAEERVSIEKRTHEIGEVLLRRTVSAERQTLTVEVARETLRVTRREMTPRAALPGEAERAFGVSLIRIPVFAEEAAHVKRPFVTGEVVVHRRPVVEERVVAETVRREAVETEIVPVERPPAISPEAQSIVHPSDAFTEVLPVVRPSALWRDVKEGFSRGRRTRP